MNEWFIDTFKDIKEEMDINDTAAAILILAHTVSRLLNKSTCETMGHELAMSLKNVLKESEIGIYNIP
jgi:hypothetical protein